MNRQPISSRRHARDRGIFVAIAITYPTNRSNVRRRQCCRFARGQGRQAGGGLAPPLDIRKSQG
jgi:hypothetical protein